MSLLPKVPGLKLEDVVIDAGSVSLALASTSLPIACPVCGQKTVSLHSHYWRTVADLPWSGRRVRLLLEVRKFRCPQRECPRRIFTERLPDLVEPYARKTTRLHEVLELVGFALGGEAGTRLIRRLGMTASPTTLLRYIRNAALGDFPAPEVIGIDDFSLHRGKKAATIIVDLERHHPVDLLPDCSAATLARWLQANPSAQTISRDGSREYARGIADGAPEALQVADRWHLLKNLREVLERVLERERKLLVIRGEISEEAHNETNEERARHCGAHADEDGQELDDILGSYAWANRKERRRRHKRRAARLEQYQRATSLKERGMTIRDISEEIGVSVRTLYRWFAAGTFPEKQPRRDKGPRLPTHVANHLIRRWNEGCHNVQKIYRELQQDGYNAPVQTIYYFARYLKAGLAPPGYASAPTEGVPKKRSSKEQRLSPRSGGWALMLPAEKLSPKQRHWLEQLHEDESHGALIHRLARRFVKMVQEGKVAELEEWLVDAQDSGFEELKSFAEGICSQNHSAVRAALRELWSNGQVEGQINRLKMLKRQSYGRAGFELLRARVLQQTA